jgi:hypothetical protein
MAGAPDIRLLEQKKDGFSEPTAMLARGVKIKIKDLEDRTKYHDDENNPFVPARMTDFEVGVQGEKNIVVPSFGTTSVIFARHFSTLRLLKRRVDLLK